MQQTRLKQTCLQNSYGVIKQRANNLSCQEYQTLKVLSHAAKNLYNKALYSIRQDFFRIKAIRKSIERSKLPVERKEALLKRKDLQPMPYTTLYHTMKNEPEYRVLNCNMSQQILKIVCDNFQSFFGLLQAKAKGSYEGKVRLPNYLAKGGHFSLVIAEFSLRNSSFIVPMNSSYPEKIRISFRLPSILTGKTVKQIRIVPKQDARFFEVQYVYKKEPSNGIYDKNNALAIDLGLDNLMTCVTSGGQSFIIDGKRIKSVNQYANKENARLRSILDMQNLKTSKRLCKMWDKRNNVIHDYLLKSCRYIVEFCKAHDIGNIVLGFNKNMTRDLDLGRSNNQNLAVLPMGKIKRILGYMCQDANISFFAQEESYTSKASFWDNDPIEKCNYSGKRVKRGLYKTSTGALINADINGALNILKKSNVVGLTALYSRGAVDTPQRIRLT